MCTGSGDILTDLTADESDDFFTLRAGAGDVDVVDIADGDFGGVAGAGGSVGLVALVDYDW